MNFFFDNMMSPVLANMMHAFADGEHAAIHITGDPRFRSDTPDEVWIQALANENK